MEEEGLEFNYCRTALREATSSKFQIPKNHQAPSSKTDACVVYPGIYFGVWCLRFGTSLELGAWGLVFRSAAAQNSEAPLGSIAPRHESCAQERSSGLTGFAPRARRFSLASLAKV